MRVNLSRVSGNPEQGEPKVNTKTGVYVDSLKEGDIVKAQVLSSGDGAVVLKTDSGYMLRARLNTETRLIPGDEIKFEISGKEKGNITLSITQAETGADENPGGIQGEIPDQTGRVSDFSDKSLAPYANKLAELSMPVTGETVDMMAELITHNPGMKLDEAAFLASHKLTGDENLMKAALALLSGGEKTNDIMKRLLALMSLPVSRESGTLSPEQGELIIQNPDSGEFAINNPGSGINNPEVEIRNAELIKTTDNIWQTTRNQISTSSPIINDLEINLSSLSSGFGIRDPEPSPLSSLTDWLMQFREVAASVNELDGLTSRQSIADVKQIITQSDIIMQSINVENVENNVEDMVTGNKSSAISAQNADPQSPDAHFPPSISQQTAQTAQPAVTSSFLADSELRILGSDTHSSDTQSAAITSLLSELPEFRDTPISVIERFANMLIRAANDGVNTINSDTTKLFSLLDKLYTRIGRNDNDGGERLKTAREELYLRLALIEDEISDSASPTKTQMLEQTHQLMNTVRLTNSIDQFAYVQLPVIIREEYKTAELFVFKKKGGKRADTENTNILLAIELEHMGHWEALINFRNKDVSIQMEVPGEKEKDHFGENTVLLHEMLAEAGFKLVNTDIKYTKHQTNPLNALSSLKKYTKAHAGMIDYLI